MILGLQQGICAGRWSCINVNKSCCNVEPVKNNTWVVCDYYKVKELVKNEI